MYDKVVSGYHNAPITATTDQKRKMQQNKLNLQNSIQSSLANAYKRNNPKITHFYNNVGYSDVPVWALFEIMTIGDYIVLMCYYMKLLRVSKTEIKAFIREFEKITDNYRQVVNSHVVSVVIPPDLSSRMNILKNFI